MNITLGADPELFLINEKTGKVVSAVGIIPGVKDKPYRSKDMPKGFGLEIDNILAEFNIPPVKTVQAFINNISYMKDYINKFVKITNPDLGILCAASQVVDEDQLQSPEAKLFGCSIDYNAYTEQPNPKPQGTSTNIRSAGFHLHIGYDNPNVNTSLELIKYLDMYLGIPSVLKDSDTARRSLYGKAGCFRLKPYGFEYRVLSSALMENVELLSFVFNQLNKGIMAFLRGIPRLSPEVVQHIINNSDVEEAKYYIKIYKLCAV